MNEPPSRFATFSPAKLNLFLEVLGRRPDGFHELESVMIRTQLCDRLWFRRLDTSDIRLELTDDTSPEIRDAFPFDDSNLIIRAAKLMQFDTGTCFGAEIQVHKIIPPQSGLAGGSSNAATTLRALNTLWDLQLPDERLHNFAAKLGSDINFLLSGHHAAICRGRGEIVEPIPAGCIPELIAVRPARGNSTADVFRRLLIPQHPRSATAAISSLISGNLAEIESACFNRLTMPALESNDEMRLLMDLLHAEFHRPVFMSGSGSTCFFCVRAGEVSVGLADRVARLTGRPAWRL